MKEDKAYLETAQRYIESCEKHVLNGIDIQEVIGFKCYHAFESIAGSYNSYLGHSIPKKHESKLNLFVSNANTATFSNRRAIAALAMTLNSLRNKFLYPNKNGAIYKSPKDVMSLTDAKALVKKVKGIVVQISGMI